MTPHDELMALAGKWEAEAAAMRTTGNPFVDAVTVARDAADRKHAADLRALLDSDAFRAMVRDAERYRWIRQWTSAPNAIEFTLPKIPHKPGANHWKGSVAGHLDAAIDAAASGAGEG